jgi:hypothetical protein
MYLLACWASAAPRISEGAAASSSRSPINAASDDMENKMIFIIFSCAFPQTFVRGSFVVKFPPCTVAFSEHRLRHYPVRAPFGADEYFLAMEAKVDPSRMHRSFYDICNQLAWHIVRSPV